MSEKYITEKFPRWFIFGEHRETGCVDVSNGGADIVTNVPRDVAERMIDEHNKVVEALVTLSLIKRAHNDA